MIQYASLRRICGAVTLALPLVLLPAVSPVSAAQPVASNSLAGALNESVTLNEELNPETIRKEPYADPKDCSWKVKFITAEALRGYAGSGKLPVSDSFLKSGLDTQYQFCPIKGKSGEMLNVVVIQKMKKADDDNAETLWILHSVYEVKDSPFAVDLKKLGATAGVHAVEMPDLNALFIAYEQNGFTMMYCLHPGWIHRIHSWTKAPSSVVMALAKEALNAL